MTIRRINVVCLIGLFTILWGRIPAATAQTLLPTGKTISPAGTAQDVGSLPMNMAVSPNGRYVVVSDMGYREYLSCLGISTGKLAMAPGTGAGTGSPSQLTFGGAHGGDDGLYYGLAIADDGDGTATIYASQGAASSIAVIKLGRDGSLNRIGVITMFPGDFPAGLALDSENRLYVAVNQYYQKLPSNVSSGIAAGSQTRAFLEQVELAALSAMTSGSMVIYNLRDPGVVKPISDAPSPAPELARVGFNGKDDLIGQVQLPPDLAQKGHPIPFAPTNYPFSLAVTADGKTVYVGCQRGTAIRVIHVSDMSDIRVRSIATGSHPVSLALNKQQNRLFVANAGSDTVTIINTLTDAVIKTVGLRPAQATTLAGATPTGLALSPDEKTLYVTLGDMNAVAIVDTESGTVRGYIPVGWYPSCVVATPDHAILVANAKGIRSPNPNPGHVSDEPPPAPRYEDRYFSENIIEGTVSRVPIARSSIPAWTSAVIANNKLSRQRQPAIPAAVLKNIKHVIYIIKENRTYDQVLGDVPGANGDPSLAIFGQSVTPNEHALAKRFVLLDNFYDSGEVSGDGWNWSTQSFANEYVIKNIPYNYSGRGRNYDFEGQNNDYIVGGWPAKGPDGEVLTPLDFPNGAPAITDVSRSPAGYLWDTANRAGISFRNYGCFLSEGVKGILPDNYPTEPCIQPAGRYLGGKIDPHFCGNTDIDYRRFDLDYADSDGPLNAGHPYTLPSYGKFQSPSRFAEWNREFQLMLRADPSGKSVPRLMTLRLMSDHTEGYRPGKPTPLAHVADNDLAVGEVVQAVSSSPIWKSTAIFVIEDDAQDGPDHVDCHRSTCYVVSPWIKPHAHDSSFYNTDSVLRTIELILGLSPLSQYDSTAPVLGDWAEIPVNNAPYLAESPAATVLSDRGPAHASRGTAAFKLEAASSKMDFLHADAAPADQLNEIIWKSVKGMQSVCPPPRHTAGVLSKSDD